MPRNDNTQDDNENQQDEEQPTPRDKDVADEFNRRDRDHRRDPFGGIW